MYLYCTYYSILGIYKPANQESIHAAKRVLYWKIAKQPKAIGNLALCFSFFFAGNIVTVILGFNKCYKSITSSFFIVILLTDIKPFNGGHAFIDCIKFLFG